MSPPAFPELRQVVLDAVDARGEAEFWRRLLGYEYRPGDEPPAPGDADPAAADWLVLRHPSGSPRVAVQAVRDLPRPTWPAAGVPQQLHLDLTVATLEALERLHARIGELGGRLLLDRAGDELEPLRVYADPAGHPFCVLVPPEG